MNREMLMVTVTCGYVTATPQWIVGATALLDDSFSTGRAGRVIECHPVVPLLCFCMVATYSEVCQ